eukprot:jgi/Picsp_1/1850/NSC_05317-R1_hypothetical protein CHLNCDRAFT_132888 [Chlorella variabilis]
MMQNRRFVDTFAVKSKSEADYKTHVAKRKQRNKELEIVFDPDSHRDYVTGFRKRKQKRRKEALKSLERIQRDQKLEERAERREAKREQYNLTEIHSTENEHQEEKDNVTKVFQSSEMVSTVHVTPIYQDSDDEMGAIVNKSMDASINAGTGQSSRGKKEEKMARNKPGGTRLSKAALDILTNTRLKVQGKKKFSKNNRARGKACKTGGGSCVRDGKSKGRKGRL